MFLVFFGVLLTFNYIDAQNLKRVAILAKKSVFLWLWHRLSNDHSVWFATLQPGIISTGLVTATEHRNQLLQRLRKVFIRRGFDGATLAHLAQATELSKATLYHHFPGGKADMLEQLVRLSISELQVRCFVHLQNRTSPAKQLTNLIQGFVEYTQHGRSDCLLAILSHHETNNNELAQHQQHIAAQFNDWQISLSQTFADMGYKPKRAQREARILLATLYGALVSARLHNDPEVFLNIVNRLQKSYA